MRISKSDPEAYLSKKLKWNARDVMQEHEAKENSTVVAAVQERNKADLNKRIKRNTIQEHSAKINSTVVAAIQERNKADLNKRVKWNVMQEHEAKVNSTVVAVVQERKKMRSHLDMLQSENNKLKRHVKILRLECSHLRSKLMQFNDIASEFTEDIDHVLAVIDGKVEARDDQDF